MAKKPQKNDKKPKTADNIKSEGLLEGINAKLKSSQKDLQKQVDDLRSQVKTLSKDPSKTARKLFKSIEKSYHKKVSELQDDFDQRMASVQKIQDNVIAQLPKELAEKLKRKTSDSDKASNKAEKTTTVKAKKSPTVKAKTKAEPKAPAKAKPIIAKTLGLASINGIGPVMQKKLLAAGFAKLEDLANTPVNKAAALKQFEKSRGYGNWKKDAQALLNKE